MNKEVIENAIKIILKEIGENPNREGLQETPKRVARMFEEIFTGYTDDPKTHLSKQFSCTENGIVLVKDIEFSSMCEHHMLPFFGKAHIAYIPTGKVVGISKLVRIVNTYAKRLQIQEQLTQQIADAIMAHVGAQGSMVVMNASHMCMVIRGVKNTSSKTQTIACTGVFKNNLEMQRKVLQQIKL